MKARYIIHWSHAEETGRRPQMTKLNGEGYSKPNDWRSVANQAFGLILGLYLKHQELAAERKVMRTAALAQVEYRS